MIGRSSRTPRSRARLPRAWLPAALAGAVAIACSSSNDASDGGGAGGSCESAPSCPDAGAPSYQTQIVPILQASCIPCHGPSGTAGYDEDTYADVYNQFGSMLSFVNDCEMPPLNGPELSNADRITLTEWLRCGAPDN
jgi:hypothetical protein